MNLITGHVIKSNRAHPNKTQTHTHTHSYGQSDTHAHICNVNVFTGLTGD